MELHAHPLFYTHHVQEMQLDDFPQELLVRIFYFLPAEVLILKVILVCRKFLDIVKDEWFWKGYFLECFGSEFPMRVCPLQALQRGCVQSEFAHGACNGKSSHMNTVYLPGTRVYAFLCVYVFAG